MARGKPKEQSRSASNLVMTDQEMLANIHDAADGNGWATTTEIARVCGYTDNGNKHKTLARKVSTRLVWMRNGQLLVSTPPDYSRPYDEPGARDTRWKLTSYGEIIRRGTLTRSVETALGKMDAGALLQLMRQLGMHYRGDDVAVAFALRREMQHHLAHRRLVLR